MQTLKLLLKFISAIIFILLSIVSVIVLIGPQMGRVGPTTSYGSVKNTVINAKVKDYIYIKHYHYIPNTRYNTFTANEERTNIDCNRKNGQFECEWTNQETPDFKVIIKSRTLLLDTQSTTIYLKVLEKQGNLLITEFDGFPTSAPS